VASAVTFGGMYAAIARGSGGGTATQAAVLELDQTAYSELTTPDATVAPVYRDDDDDDEHEEHESDDDEGEEDESDDEDDEDDEGEARASVATATPSTGNAISPTTAPTQAPVATQQPVTKTRGS
jgi:septal ring-binding cell division protein DamX